MNDAANLNDMKNVLFCGSLAELASAILLSDYEPRYTLWFISLWGPHVAASLVWYTFQVSFALCLVNLAPVMS